jgi:hypothetical protein
VQRGPAKRKKKVQVDRSTDQIGPSDVDPDIDRMLATW